MLQNNIGLDDPRCAELIDGGKVACFAYELCAARARAKGIDCPPVLWPECKEELDFLDCHDLAKEEADKGKKDPDGGHDKKAHCLMMCCLCIIAGKIPWWLRSLNNLIWFQGGYFKEVYDFFGGLIGYDMYFEIADMTANLKGLDCCSDIMAGDRGEVPENDQQGVRECKKCCDIA